MLQGPMGLAQTTGRTSTLISYSYRSVLHDLALPEAEPAEPQVAYTPLSSDLPVFSGAPVSGLGAGAYRDSWYNYYLFTIRNYGSTNRTVYYRYRTSSTAYSTGSFTAYSNSQMNMTCTYGLSTPGLGLEEAYKFYCPTGAGEVKLHKSWFTVMPTNFYAGPVKDLRDVRVLSTVNSIFGEKKYWTDSMMLYAQDMYPVIINTDDFSYPCSRCSNYYTFAFGVSKPYLNISSSSITGVAEHNQPRYPTAIIYSMSVR